MLSQLNFISQFQNMMMTQQSPVDTSRSEILEGMRKQEQAYICGDYLYQEGSLKDRLALPQTAINVTCRTSMLQWMQTVVNFIGFDPETVEISMSYLDRFLTTKAGQEAIHCRTIYQLAAMTALYTAVKINCAEALTPKLLAELSQGAYQADQFEEMERIMLNAISWRVNPPTGASFVRETLDMLPQSLFQSEDLRQAVLDMARLQAEWAVSDYELLSVKRSVVAFAAVNNSLKSNRIRFNLPKFLQQAVQGQQIELDIQQAIMIQKTLRGALPADEVDEGMDTSMLSTASTRLESDDNDDDHQSVQSVDDNDVAPKRISAGRSPRSVASRTSAA